MVWSLASAELRCLARRVRGALGAAPVASAAALAAALALPPAALVLGIRIAEELRALAHVRSFVAGGALSAVAAGAVLALAAPRPDAAGRQVLAAPVRRTSVLIGVCVVPAALGVAALLVPASLLVAPAVGWWTPAVLASAVGAAGAGAACAAFVAALSRGSGPHAVERPVHGYLGIALARYVRRAELRRQCAGVLFLTAVGGVSLRVAGVDARAGCTLAASLALFGALVFPLAAAGIDRGGAWLWRSCPRSAAALAAANFAAASALGALAASAGAAVALAVLPTSPWTLVPLAAAAALLLTAALLAGALVPWRSDRVGEQLGAFTAFACVAGGTAAALARVAPHVGAVSGARAAALALVTAALLFASAVGVAARRA